MSFEGEQRNRTEVPGYYGFNSRGSLPTYPAYVVQKPIRPRPTEVDGIVSGAAQNPNARDVTETDRAVVEDTDRYFRKPMIVDDEAYWAVCAVREFAWVPSELEVQHGYFDEHRIYAGLKFPSFDEAYRVLSEIAAKGHYGLKKKNEPKRGMFVVVCSRSGNPAQQYKRKLKRQAEKREAKKNFRPRQTASLVCNCAFRVRFSHCEPPEGEVSVEYEKGVEYNGWIQITMTYLRHNHDCNPKTKGAKTPGMPSNALLQITADGDSGVPAEEARVAPPAASSSNSLAWESRRALTTAVDPIQRACQSHPTPLNLSAVALPREEAMDGESFQERTQRLQAPMDGGVLYVEGKRYRVRPTPSTVAQADSGMRVLQYTLSNRGHEYTVQRIREILSECHHPTWLMCTRTYVFNFNIEQWRHGMRTQASLEDMGMLAAVFEFGLNMVLYSTRGVSSGCDLTVYSAALDQRLSAVAPASFNTSDKSLLPYYDLPVYYEPGQAFHILDRDIDSTLPPEMCWRVHNRP